MQPTSEQLRLTSQSSQREYEEPSSTVNKSLSVHRWTNWIAGFSGEFARTAIQQHMPFSHASSVVMDPFAGVGTTLLEAYRQGINCIGFEINPFATLVCNVKLTAPSLSLPSLQDAITRFEQFIEPIEYELDRNEILESIDTLPELQSLSPVGFKSRIPFYSPKVERKVLYSLDFIQSLTKDIGDVFRIALASVMVEFSNYSYEPSLGSRPGAGKQLVPNADVGQIVGRKLHQIAEDISLLQIERARQQRTPHFELYPASFFDAERYVEPGTVDLVVTSPPYMNNYHYVRNTRPQLFWTGLVARPKELKELEENNFGKFWQTVRGSPPILLEFSLASLEMQIEEINQLNPDRGDYGGKGWANYVTTYMNDLYRFCGLLVKVLRPGSTAVVVLGNSVIQGKEVAVDRYFTEIGSLQGLSTVGVNRSRKRVGSSIVNSGVRLTGDTKPRLYDAVVTLRRD